MKFSDTTATQKIFNLRKRIRAVAGGTSASKTISILVWCIDYAQTHPGELISVVSESFPHLEDGAIRDFTNIMQGQGYWEDSRWHGTKHEYTFESGSIIEFTSVDTYGKAHGPRRDVLFINEANNLTYEIVDQLITRTRKIVWMDWNPSTEFYFYTDMLPNRTDIDFITLTYKDNEALDAVTISEIESHRHNKRWWKVYGEGQLGDIEGRVYTGWQIIDEVPFEARLERRGLDFGYTNDPTALIAIYYHNGGYILDEELYQKGLSNKQIADFIGNLERNTTLIKADSAEPKSIDEIKSYGVNIVGVLKGKDSINQGIQRVQDQRISVTKRSVNLIKEYRNYMFETDKQGILTNKPIDMWNHCFIGSTQVITGEGLKAIKDITDGMVLTSEGYKKVLKRFDNGIKEVTEYLLQFDTFTVQLTCTPDHKIKTTGGWKEIQNLQPADTLYLSSLSTGIHTDSIQESGTTLEDVSVSTLLSGNITTEQNQKDTTSTTSTEINQIIELKTSYLSNGENTYQSTLNDTLPNILNGLQTFMLKVLKKLKSGTAHLKASNGTVSTGKPLGKVESTENVSVSNAVLNTPLGTEECQSSVIKTANLVHLEHGEKRSEQVYDLSVEDCHEYFANGVLVHNCMDGVRYGFEGLLASFGGQARVFTGGDRITGHGGSFKAIGKVRTFKR